MEFQCSLKTFEAFLKIKSQNLVNQIKYSETPGYAHLSGHPFIENTPLFKDKILHINFSVLISLYMYRLHFPLLE